jgi:predicted ATPase
MDLKLDIVPGNNISNEKLMDIFKCGIRGSMRRSLSTNTLVLISDYNSSVYENAWQENGIWHFPGMGTSGDQSLDYIQNKTLSTSNSLKIHLHLFISEGPGVYTYKGKVLLAGNPYPKESVTNNMSRNILIFPLIEVGKSADITDFLLKFTVDDLRKKNILDYPRNMLTYHSIEPLISLMKDHNIDTLTSSGGWYLTSSGYFNNDFSTGDTCGNIDKLINEKIISFKDVIKDQNKYLNPFYKNSLVFEDINERRKPLQDENDERKGNPINQFRIISLKYDNETLYDRIKFGNFNESTPQINKKYFYTTLLIGPNGTGKSMILSIVQKVFTDMYRLNLSKIPEIDENLDYELTYSIAGERFKIEQKNKTISFYKSGEKVSIKKLILPEKVITCAFTLQDRFSVFDGADLVSKYNYLGLKSFSGIKSIQEYYQAVTSNIMLAALDSNILKNFKGLTNFLEFEPIIKIQFTTKNKIKIENFITTEEIVQRQSEKKNLNKIFANDINKLIRRINLTSILSSEDTFYISDENLTITLNLDEADKYETLYDDFMSILHLVELDFFEQPVLLVKKNNKLFPINEASSGEYQYISTMVNILSKIKTNSLIIMDEPETSLHPTWQYRYVSQLQDIFDDFDSCHFLMATHSHFLVADIEPESSSTVILTEIISFA